jgi:phenylpyruvate tautomerase PptA (4-oxalocrotonate tautomerase family)
MPLIELTLPATNNGGRELRRLVADLTDIVLSCEGAPVDSVTARELTWCIVHRAHATYVAGGREAHDRYVLRVTLPEGILGPNARTRLIRESTEAVAVFDGNPDAPARTACLIVEVPDGRFGWAGETVTKSSLRMLTREAPATLRGDSARRHEGRARPPAGTEQQRPWALPSGIARTVVVRAAPIEAMGT